MMQRIYLDNNATTKIDPQVVDAMLHELSFGPANPSSIHFYGQEAKKRLTKARDKIADLLSVKSSEIVFTSGGTEGMNFLIHHFLHDIAAHVLSSPLEHPCTLEPLASHENLTLVEPNLPAIEKAIRADTKLLIFSAANSETGLKLDIDAVANLALEKNISLIIDGVGLLGRDDLSLPEGVSGWAFSGHKIHGPKGIGFVILKKGHKGPSLIKGGGQEYGLRSGTENLPGIVGLGKALELTLKNPTDQIREKRDAFETLLLASPYGIEINGDGNRVANTSNLYFPLLDGESLLIHLDLEGIAVSHGSACSAGSLEPSKVLLSMGYPRERARNSLRFSLSRNTTHTEIEIASSKILQILERFATKGKKVPAFGYNEKST